MRTQDLQLFQMDWVMTEAELKTKTEDENEMDVWQSCFCKLIPKLFSRVGRIRNVKVREDFFDILKPAQQKDRRVPIVLQVIIGKEPRV